MFETKRELREKIELLTERIEDLNRQLIKAGSDAAYYGNRYDHYMRECLSLKREIRASKRISEIQAGVGIDLVKENEKLKKENEALKKQLEMANVNVDSFYPSNAWSVVAELMISKQANCALKEKLVKLQDKIDAIEKIVED